MNSIFVAATVLAFAFGGVLFGIGLRLVIPAAHLNRESKDGIQIGTGLIATMAALVLGLLIGGAKSSFEAERTGLQDLATNVVLLDRTLDHYGPDTQPARAQLRAMVTAVVEHFDQTNRGDDPGLADDQLTRQGGQLLRAIENLEPVDDWHRGARSHALQITADLARARWQLTQQNDQSLPVAILVVLLFWFFVLFASLGTFWARNITVVVVLFMCALSVATALFLIVDLSQPFEGVIQVSSQSLDDALAQIRK